MAPKKPVTNFKAKAKKSSSASSSKPSSSSNISSTSSTSMKPRTKSKPNDNVKKPTGVKKPAHLSLHKKKKQRTYTDKELGIPILNSIIPAGVVKPAGKKKGKVFVEDKDTMLGILSLVNDSKDGQIQSKLERGRQLETIREQRRKEQEAKELQKTAKFEDAKDSVRRKRKRNTKSEALPVPSVLDSANKGSRKRVSFAS